MDRLPLIRVQTGYVDVLWVEAEVRYASFNVLDLPAFGFEMRAELHQGYWWVARVISWFYEQNRILCHAIDNYQ